MAKLKISDYSSTSAGANLNTDINSIDIDEGCAPSGINNAIRTLMAQVKDFQTGVSGDGLTLGGALSGTSATFSGNVTASAISGASLTLSGALSGTSATFSGNVTASAISGASLTLSGNVTASAISGASMTLSGDLTVDTDTLYVDSASNNVGIGTSSPGAKLDVDGQIYSSNGTAAAPGLTSRGQNNAGLFFTDDGVASVLGFSAGGTERMRITGQNGNVGIGTSSPQTRLDISASANPRMRFEDVGDFEWRVGIVDNSSFGFFSSGSVTERMRIDSSGNLLVGTTGLTANGKLTVNGQSRFYESTSDGTAAARFDKSSATTTTSQIFVQFTVNGQASGSGQINANGANTAAFGSFSDVRLKENIEPLSTQLNNIMALKPCEFDYKGYENGDGHQIGFIAQEMKEVYPDVVGEGEDGMLTITGWSKTEARLVKAIQELKAELDAVKSELNTLKGN